MHLVSGNAQLAEGSVFNKEVHFADGAERGLAYRILKQVLVICVHRSFAHHLSGALVDGGATDGDRWWLNEWHRQRLTVRFSGFGLVSVLLGLVFLIPILVVFLFLLAYRVSICEGEKTNQPYYLHK